MATDGLPIVTLTCENRRSPEGAVNTPGPLDPQFQLPEGGPSVSIVKPPGAESKWSTPREGR